MIDDYINRYNSYIGCYNQNINHSRNMNYDLKDYGPNPVAIDLEDIAMENDNFRTTIWTGKHLQVTVMSIDVGQEIGLEVHENDDQLILVKQGMAMFQIGDERDKINMQKRVEKGYALMIPAGKWHNIVNVGNIPLKLVSIYAPPNHPKDTINITKEDEK